MKCPACKCYQSKEINLQSGQFTEEIVECELCGTMWATNHGLTEIVLDGQQDSFLELLTEPVESGDYNI